MKRRFCFWGFLFLLGCAETFGCRGGAGPAPISPPPQKPPAAPPSNPSPTVRFFTFGDWGADDASVPPQKNQIATALKAQEVCASSGCDFGLFLGDNFYSTGVSDVNDPQWQTKYRDIYGVHTALQIPLYALLGNHDWDAGIGRAQAQVDFDLQDQDPWWRMPAFYYSVQFSAGETLVVEIFVINSNNFAADLVQQNWLSQALALSTAPWKIVAMHHPIFSNGPHPPDEKNMYLLTDGSDGPLKKIICGKVDLLLAGHNHLFSRLQASDGCGFDQLIVGTGGKFLYNPTLSPPELVFTESCFGVGYFEAQSKQLNFTFHPATDPSADLCLDGTRGSPYASSWQKP